MEKLDEILKKVQELANKCDDVNVAKKTYESSIGRAKKIWEKKWIQLETKNAKNCKDLNFAKEMTKNYSLRDKNKEIWFQKFIELADKYALKEAKKCNNTDFAKKMYYDSPDTNISKSIARETWLNRWIELATKHSENCKNVTYAKKMYSKAEIKQIKEIWEIAWIRLNFSIK